VTCAVAVKIVTAPGSRDTLIFLGNQEEANEASFARALEAVKGTIEGVVQASVRERVAGDV
jgi:Mn-containing catalase